MLDLDNGQQKIQEIVKSKKIIMMQHKSKWQVDFDN